MVGCCGHLPRHPRRRARLCGRPALLGRARPPAGAERAGGRADRAEPRARARAGGLAQQPGHRAAGSARAGRGDRRVPARDRTRSGACQRAQQSRCGAASAGQGGRGGGGVSNCDSPRSRALGRVPQPGRPAEQPETVARGCRLLLPGHHAEAEGSRGAATPGARPLHARRGRQGGRALRGVAARGAGQSHCPAHARGLFPPRHPIAGVGCIRREDVRQLRDELRLEARQAPVPGAGAGRGDAGRIG